MRPEDEAFVVHWIDIAERWRMVLRSATAAFLIGIVSIIVAPEAEGLMLVKIFGIYGVFGGMLAMNRSNDALRRSGERIFGLGYSLKEMKRMGRELDGQR